MLNLRDKVRNGEIIQDIEMKSKIVEILKWNKVMELKYTLDLNFKNRIELKTNYRQGCGIFMRMVIVAGTPGSGKTAVLIHALRSLNERGLKSAVVKIDCLYTDDGKKFAKIGIPTKVGLSMDMCPDHYAIYNLEEMMDGQIKTSPNVLVVETAGLMSPMCTVHCEQSGSLCYRCYQWSQHSVKGRSLLEHCGYCSNHQGRYDIPGRKGNIPGKDP